ncbi:MAG: bifunctional heptose 7-phosphate kinase/heptose 1-phosphate adenyltransferase [Bacteroidia bacterium]
MKDSKYLKNIFRKFSEKKVLIIGDVMIDSYLWGTVERISPEAPVPVVSVTKKEMRPGGAANVAINIQSMGANPVLCSVIGNDDDGKKFIALLKKQKLNAQGIVVSKKRSTTVKTRVIGNKHQLIRVDEEINDELDNEDAEKLNSLVAKLIQSEKPDVIIFEDYDKGVLSPKVIKFISALALKKNIPVAVDPKKKNFIHYKNVALFKPNLKELHDGLKTDMDDLSVTALKKNIHPFREKQKIGMLMVTLSEAGIYFSSNGEDKIIPAHVRSVSDVSGAGDTVISVAALCVACGLPPHVIAELSNLAGGLVCEEVGVVPIDRNQLMMEASKLFADK